jgi:hypothetical protein
MDIEMGNFSVVRLVRGRMNAVDRTGIDAVVVLGTGVGDDVCHYELH